MTRPQTRLHPAVYADDQCCGTRPTAAAGSAAWRIELEHTRLAANSDALLAGPAGYFRRHILTRGERAWDLLVAPRFSAARARSYESFFFQVCGVRAYSLLRVTCPHGRERAVRVSESSRLASRAADGGRTRGSESPRRAGCRSRSAPRARASNSPRSHAEMAPYFIDAVFLE